MNNDLRDHRLAKNTRNLGFAQARRDWKSVLAICKRAFDEFRKYGNPSDEDVAKFRRAAENAIWEIRFAEEKAEALAKWDAYMAKFEQRAA